MLKLLGQRVFSTINKLEIAKFRDLSDKWSSNAKEFHLLKLLNPLRIKYILEHVSSIKSCKVVDIGCGGGLLSLPLARLGANVIGIDPCAENINSAVSICAGAKKNGNLDLEFYHKSIELLPQENKFDLIVASEVIEHVNNQEDFVKQCLNLLNPRGVLFISTINNTAVARLLVVYAAERMLGLVPQGTHDPKKFFAVSRLQRITLEMGPSFKLENIQGIIFVPLINRWFKVPDPTVNYFAIIRKGRSAPGQALTDALDELIQNQQITPQLAMRVLFQFDRVMSESLNSMVRGRCTIKGHLSNYRYLDDVWTFIVKDAEVRFDDDTLISKHLKIVACNARKSETNAK